MAITLTAGDLKQSDHYFVRYAVQLASSVSLDRALEPGFWAHVGHNLRPFDRIDMLAEDGSFLAETIVTNAGRGFAKVRLLAKHDLGADLAESDDEPLEVKWGGPAGKWMVIRRSDKVKLRDGLPDKRAAQEFALNYERAVVA